MNDISSKSDPHRPVIALFDFDGTLTTRDSLIPFLCYLYGYRGLFRILLTTFPQLMGFLCRYTSRQDAKEALLTAAFKGCSPLELQPKAEKYAQTSLEKLVKPHALERLTWHQQQGHRCVIVSASISLYLRFWVAHHGAPDLLCSELALDISGAYTGKLAGNNCWGPEKVKRIEALLGPLEKYTLYAYGDSRGDQEMLEIADYPYHAQWDS